MSKQREAFAKWRESLTPALGSDFNSLDQEALYLVELAWKASREAALEEAQELCAEVTQGEAAYSRGESAAYDCVCRIRALKEQS